MRCTMIFAASGLLLALPWPTVVLLGWDADLGLLSNSALPDAGMALRAGAALLARLSWVLAAPALLLAAGVRGALARVVPRG